MSVHDALNEGKTALDKHGAAIMSGLAVAGVIGTVVLAVKATPKAYLLVEDEKKAQDVETLPLVDVAKVAWKPYISTALVGAGTIGLIVGASIRNTNKISSLAGAYSLAQGALVEYKDKVVEVVGKNKAEKIHDEIMSDHMDQHPITEKNGVINTGKGDTLCFDNLSGRYFLSDKNELDRIVNELNRELIADDWVSLNTFYYKLGLEPIRMGEDMGWNADNAISYHLSTRLVDDSKPCMVIDFSVGPIIFGHSID